MCKILGPNPVKAVFTSIPSAVDVQVEQSVNILKDHFQKADVILMAFFMG